MSPKLAPSRPYQPLLLRLLHGSTALALFAALFTAYWTYDTYDGRWGKIPLPHYPAIEGLHGTFGLWVLLIFPAFVIYAFQRGQRRLLQPDSFQKLTQGSKPIWWYTLNRGGNTLALVALAFALFSGKMMDETWLPRGELNHGWYSAHLISWGVMLGAIALHLLLNAKVGGTPLLLSMFTLQFRDPDSPRHWPAHLSRWWAGVRRGGGVTVWRPMTAMRALEIILLITVIMAWVLPLLK